MRQLTFTTEATPPGMSGGPKFSTIQEPDPGIRIATYHTTTARARHPRNCDYCRADIDEGDKLWHEHKTGSYGCCNACTISAAKLAAKTTSQNPQKSAKLPTR